MKHGTFNRSAVNKALIVALSTSGLAMASMAQAEQQNGSAANAMMEVIEVKSRKLRNAEPIQETPLAVTAFGEKQLDALNVDDLSDLTFNSPNVQFEEVGTIPGVQNFSFRGQGINSSIPSVDPTVGTFIDGVFLGTTYGVVLDMYDVESIEILRGPQGLLLGRNVTGGAVSIRTKRPGEEFNASVKFGITDSDSYTIAGTVEGTLVDDKLRGKLVVYRNDDDGYFDYEGTGHQSQFTIPGTDVTITPTYFTPEGEVTGAMETEFYRGTLVYDATDNLEFTLIGETGSVDGDGAAWQSTIPILDAANGEYLPNPQGEFTTAGDEAGLTDGEWNQLIFETNYEIGNGVLTNILGWREVDMLSVFDLDGSPVPIFAVSADTEQDQISNEIRYAGSAFDDKLDYTVGYYYFEQDISYLEGRLIFGGARRVALGGNMDHKTTGIFASGDYHLSERLTLTAGLRYTKEDKDANVIDSTNGSCQDVFTFNNCTFINLARDWSSVTPKLGLDYKLTDNALLYTFWTKGFRSGGVNFRNAKPELFNPGPTDDESQDSYELGIKSDLFDDRLRLNAAFFFNEIDDIQREINVADPDVIVLQATLNAGDAEIKGFEIDFVGVVTDNFTLAGSVGVLDGDYTFLVPETADQFGEDLPRLAELSYSLSANYSLDLAENGFVDFQLGYSYRDETAYLDNNNAYFPEAKDLKADITWSNLDGNLSVSLYGKNLKDEPRWGNITGSGFWGPMQRGRIIGLEVKYSLM